MYSVQLVFLKFHTFDLTNELVDYLFLPKRLRFNRVRVYIIKTLEFLNSIIHSASKTPV